MMKRIWEVDAARALALTLMLVQHVPTVWNVVFEGVPTTSLLFVYVGKVGALLFLALVGLSGWLSYLAKIQHHTFDEVNRLFFKRGLFLLCVGFIISIISFFVVPYAPILFGVLSLIGLAVILLPYFIKYPVLSWITMVTSPFIGHQVSSIHPATFNFIVVGSYPSTFRSLDYWPVFPWIGIVLIGVELGRRVYKTGRSKVPVTYFSIASASGVQWIGRHTLLLYVIHVPILYLLFSFFKSLIW